MNRAQGEEETEQDKYNLVCSKYSTWQAYLTVLGDLHLLSLWHLSNVEVALGNLKAREERERWRNREKVKGDERERWRKKTDREGRETYVSGYSMIQCISASVLIHTAR